MIHYNVKIMRMYIVLDNELQKNNIINGIKNSYEDYEKKIMVKVFMILINVYLWLHLKIWYLNLWNIIRKVFEDNLIKKGVIMSFLG